MNRTLKIFVFGLLAILLSAPVFATPESDGVIGEAPKEFLEYGEALNSFKENDQQQPPPAENAPQTQDGGSGDTVADESEDSTDDDVGSDDEDSTDDALGSDDEGFDSGGEDE